MQCAETLKLMCTKLSLVVFTVYLVATNNNFFLHILYILRDMCDENNNTFFAPLVFLSEKNPEDIILGETPIILSTGSQFEAKVFSGPNINLC